MMIETVTSIWQRLLRRSSIRAEDNFFDLGGNPSMAVQLFSEIAQVYGRELPPSMIYCAPTIAALAAMLEQPTLSRFPPLVLLRSGTGNRPVFIAHGLGGNVMDLFLMVKHLRSPHPIYGLQARGLDGVDEPFERIEDMAQFHLNAIKELQPHGPYQLIGYSLGGLVMLEIAQRLSQNGSKIALLAMIESYPHSRFLSLTQRLRLLTRLAQHHASSAMQLPLREALSYILRHLAGRLHISGDGHRSMRDRRPDSVSFSQAVARVRDSAYRALECYRPRFYKGKLRFVRAEISTEFPKDAAGVWSNLTDEFEVETIPGDHLGILTVHFETLASVLSRYLGDTSSSE
jgi:acetoacetyl-CoA synthetase